MPRLLSASIALAGALVAAPAASALTPGELFPVSGTPGASTFLPGRANDAWLGGKPGATSFLGSENTRKISDDGRYVVFLSKADALSTIDDDRLQNIYVQDRATGSITLVNVPAAGGRNGDASQPVISGNGRKVAFATEAGLVPLDTDGASDVYVRDLDAGTTQLVSTTAALIPITPGATSSQPDLSHDGAHVSFTTTDQFKPADTDALSDIYVNDLATGTLRLLSRATGAGGADSNGSASDSAINFDGSAVAFTSSATNLDAADADTGSDVFLRSGTATSLVSRAAGGAGAKGIGQSVDPAISSDGRQVAFVSIATNLAAPDASPTQSVFLRDTDPGALTTVLISRRSQSEGGADANQISTSPTIGQSAGTLVAFTSEASNLVTGLPNAKLRAFVRSVGAGTTTLASRADGAGGAPATTFGSASIATAGTAVAFQALGPELSTEDDDHFNKVFVRDGATTTWRSRPPAGTPWQGGAGDSSISSNAGVVSADGSAVAFESSADGHTPPGTNVSVTAVRNLRTGSITVASRADGADGAIGRGYQDQVSADGTKVVFVSDSALAPGTVPGVYEVYQRDLVTNTTKLVSQHLGVPANSSVFDPSMSPDGRYVAYFTGATNLGVAIAQPQVFLTDIQTGVTTLVSRQNGPAGAPPLTSADEPSVSADGTKVAFATSDTTLSPADTDTNTSIYVRDVAAGTTSLVSRTAAGATNDSSAYEPHISSDGSKVIFETDAKNLDAADTDAVLDLYSAELSTGAVTRLTPPGGTDGVDSFAVSADGSTIAWTTSDKLSPDDTDAESDVYAKDAVAGGATTLVGRKGDGTPLDGTIGYVALSADGGCIAMSLARSGTYGSGPLLSPAIPGTEPSPDFGVVVLRALKPTCVASPPSAGGSGGGGSSTPLKDTAAPQLSKVSVSNKRFRRTSKQTALSARAGKKAKSGTKVRFTLSETATVTLAFEQKTTGRKVGKSCKKETAKLRSRKACTRYVAKGTLTRKGLAAGAQSVAFSGRIGKKALPVGSYRITLTAKDPTGNASAPARVTFSIVTR